MPEAPQPPPGAVTITSATLEQLRKTGSRDIAPNPATIEWMVLDGVKLVSVDLKLCISTPGLVAYAEIVKPSDYPSYAERIRLEAVDWTFRPFKQNAIAVPACSIVTINYQPPPRPTAPATPPVTGAALAALRADVEMICGAAKATGGTDFIAVGPYIAEHMKTDLLADLFANIRTTSLAKIVGRVRGAMAVTRIARCATIDVLVSSIRK
jgi:hypothetical protein